MFPSPHSTSVGQSVVLDLAPGQHTLTVALKRPDDVHGVAEWVIGLAEHPSQLWIAGAFRP